MKGIVLAGGNATRLRPVTQVVSKQLLPIYDKPMVYYPLATLMLADIKEILIITKPEDYSLFHSLLGDGSTFGVNLKYVIQMEANGLAQAFVLGEQFINGDSCALVLGDNLLYGEKFEDDLKEARQNAETNGLTTIFGKQVARTQDFGIVEFDENGKVVSIEEKPTKARSNYAIPGLYFYTNDVCEKARKLKPSIRGEYEITDLNKMYLEEKRLTAINISEKCSWFDTGSFDGFIEANKFVSEQEKNSGKKIAYLEEIAFDKNWLSREKLLESAKKYEKSPYGEYLKSKADCIQDESKPLISEKSKCKKKTKEDVSAGDAQMRLFGSCADE